MSFRNVLTITMTVVAGCICVILATLPALAAECPRGTLDKQYCDRNGDLVADLPLDEKDWVNPSTIIFSYTPVEDPAIYAKVWDGFVKHLSEVTGKKAVFFPVQSYAAQYEAMRRTMPWLNVVGGCCGSDLRHVTAIARTILADAA